MDKDTLVSILGPALVIGFIVIIVLAVIADKTANKRFDKKIESKYKIKEQLGGMNLSCVLHVQRRRIVRYCREDH